MRPYCRQLPTTSMVELKAAELSAWALRYAVAVAEGLGEELCWHFREDGSVGNIWVDNHGAYWPDELWEIGGPLIDKYHVQTSYNGNGFSQSPTREYWCAYVCKPSGQEERPSGGGPTALVAICRAIVAAKLGDVISVPVELMQR